MAGRDGAGRSASPVLLVFLTSCAQSAEAVDGDVKVVGNQYDDSCSTAIVNGADGYSTETNKQVARRP